MTCSLVGLAGSARSAANQGSSLLRNLWTRVVVQPLSDAEMCLVIAERFSSLAAFAPRLLDVCVHCLWVQVVCSCPSWIVIMNYLLLLSTQVFQKLQGLDPRSHVSTVVRSGSRRLLSFRDLVKWCVRSAAFVKPPSTVTSVSFTLAKVCRTPKLWCNRRSLR
jgi:hypothetical protein